MGQPAERTPSKVEGLAAAAIAEADLELETAGLPTYSEVVAALRELARVTRDSDIEEVSAEPPSGDDWDAALTTAEALLAKVPA